jgi:hypothetical protein
MSGHESLTAFSEAIADAVAKASASVVSVAARRHVPASGIVWAPGVIVTADHALEREENIFVVTAAGAELSATIAGRDPGSDLAVLKVDGAGLTIAERGGALRPGNLVVAVGRAGGEGVTCSIGGVVALGGSWRTSRGTPVAGYVRSEVTLYPGYSGGGRWSTPLGASSRLTARGSAAGAGSAYPSRARRRSSSRCSRLAGSGAATSASAASLWRFLRRRRRRPAGRRRRSLSRV